MARFLTAIIGILFFSVSFPATGQSPESISTEDSMAIQNVIAAQVAAFRRNDAIEAYGYASPSIQAKFPSPDIFMKMVRNGYRAVYRPQSFEFREVSVTSGQIVQEVLFIGPDGRPAIALYKMQKQEDGGWRINGVQLLALPGESARLKYSSELLA